MMATEFGMGTLTPYRGLGGFQTDVAFFLLQRQRRSLGQ
jgi:hypothetical protein